MEEGDDEETSKANGVCDVTMMLMFTRLKELSGCNTNNDSDFLILDEDREVLNGERSGIACGEIP